MTRRPFLFLLLFFSPAAAFAALDGPPITDNGYRLDLSRGVASGSTEKIAMGGAGVAWGERSGALADNPASVAAARPGPDERAWDWDGTLASQVVGGLDDDNNGSRSTTYRRHRVITAGGLIRVKAWGVGLLGLTQEYDVATSTAVRRFELMESHLILGQSPGDGSLSWGVGLRMAGFRARTKETKQRLLELSGGGLVLGFRWNPHRGPWHWGFSHQGPIQDNPDRVLSGGPVAAVDGLILPRAVDLPAATTVGVTRRGERFLWTADVRVIGRVEEAYGVESFLEQKVQHSGRKASFSPRGGLEHLALPGRLRIRAGAYYEPSRFQGVHGRCHATLGAEAKLFKLNWFGARHVSLSYALDAAPRYAAHFLSLGFWRGGRD